MRLFYFILKCGRQSIPDVEGQELPDSTAARRHAIAVARDLMRHREIETRAWRIQVCDDYLQPLFQVLFAQVDNSIHEVHARQSRLAIKRVAQTVAAFNDAYIDARTTLNEVYQTLARADQILKTLPGGSRR